MCDVGFLLPTMDMYLLWTLVISFHVRLASSINMSGLNKCGPIGTLCRKVNKMQVSVHNQHFQGLVCFVDDCVKS